MPLLAEVVDAVVGGDTHRDTHALEMTAPAGVTISTLVIDNDDAGFAEALAWIVEHAPGGRVVVGLEGTRSYGIGLARAIQTSGLVVVEVEHPKRSDRRRGKSDPIDAHLAALHTLRLDADQLPTPRADGEREALRILLGARRELTMVRTGQINRLRALLLTGDDADRELARGTLTDTRLTAISRRRGRSVETVEQEVRRAEARRLAIAIRESGHELKDTRSSSLRWRTSLHPAFATRSGWARSVLLKPLCLGRMPGAVATMPLSQHWPAPARSQPAADGWCGTATTAAAIEASTAPCTTSP